MTVLPNELYTLALLLLLLLAVYVVFGAAGAVGSDLVQRLAAQQGARVVASDRDHSDLDELSKAVKEATIVPADTQDPDAVRTSPLPPTSSAHA